ncbi:CheR family methyltransferase [Pseudaestuariivita rosea]|uniref:CheR family methyltransferase n=1 Tax=Pseudaestuariivita rosea TaxID=2763263 RepID=UPI001ABBCC5A|nr:protein-glutamate O-methyltransferase [Pseudaestuariivita rosea]
MTQHFSDAHFMKLASLAHREAGLLIPPGKKSMIHSRLSNRLRALKLADFGEYHDFVTSPKGADERKKMISALTTNVTSFFREQHHFDLLKEDVIPELVKQAKAGHPVRLWSAGCSSGPEPFSIAMSLIENIADIDRLDIRILATDIDTNMIQTAKRGFYNEREISGVDEGRKKRFLTPANMDGQSGYLMHDNLRKLIAFRELNLLSKWPMKGTFDVIFCRNVVIYFDEQTQDNLWSRFKKIMKPGGWLIVGHSERLGEGQMQDIQSAGVTTYRKTAAKA